jgi:hypothetical protein
MLLVCDLKFVFFFAEFFLFINQLDSVMLSSGICQVKILRKNFDLGLSIICIQSSFVKTKFNYFFFLY